MVKTFLILFLAVISLLTAQEVKVTAEMNVDQDFVEGRPLSVTLWVTHNIRDKVDLKSALLDGKPLVLEYIKEVTVSSNEVMNLYRFRIEGKQAGLYILPPISIVVGRKKYQSIPITYEVKPMISQKEGPEATLHLEAIVEGKMPLYPGQRARLVYRFLFSGNIDLTKEVLPMLDPRGLKKIGEKDITEGTKGHLNVTEISQVVEAVEPGHFNFGPSIIEGNAYQITGYDEKTYFKPKLRAEAPAIMVDVAPFPKEGKPAAFDGAVGEFSFNIQLLSSSKLRVGDKLLISMIVTGKGALNTVKAPAICCQPGFSGLFQEDDLPPPGQMINGKKVFEIELRPLSTQIHAFPSIQFAFFNPETKQYMTLLSDAIPLQVILAEQKEKEMRPLEKEAETKETVSIEIEGNYILTPLDVTTPFYETWWVLLIVPVGAILIILQEMLKEKWERVEEVRITSSDLLVEGIALHQSNLINQALILRLVEVGILKEPLQSPDLLPVQGICGEVRDVLLDIEKHWYVNGEETFTQKQAKDIQRTYKRIKK